MYIYWHLYNFLLFIFFTFYLDFNIINHPVHIITKDNQTSPSAFIPFCDFGGDLSLMARKTDLFEVPVCNSFQAKVLNDQLCYEVDLNELSNKNNLKRELKSGFNFIMDYNEDRQLTFNHNFSRGEDMSLTGNVVESDKDQHAVIYLNTVGKSTIRKLD